MKQFAALWVLCIALSACGNDTGKKDEPQASEAPAAEMPKDYYKRFAGTVAGMPVVVNIEVYNNRVHGDYYYEKYGKPVELNDWEDTVKNDAEWYLTEYDAGKQEDNSPHWLVKIEGNTIKGKWISGDKTKMYDIALQEAYPEGSYKFDLRYNADSVKFKPSMEASASSTWQILQSKDTAIAGVFIDAVIKARLGCDSLKQNDIVQCLLAQDKSYFDAYKQDMAELDSEMLASPTANYSSDVNLWVCYNDNGIVGINQFSSSYSGGAHGMYQSLYTVIDARNQEVFKLDDVLKPTDSNAVSNILANKVRETYKLQPGASLTEVLFEDRVMLTENFMLTHKGILFCYSPYEIAAYAMGEVKLFVPYAEIKGMLQPAFIKRMGL